MKLIIAEKPSLALSIAQALEENNLSKNKSFYELSNGDKVTWLFGHMYEQYMPSDYDKKYKLWSIRTLPIFPDKWKLKEKEDAKEQIRNIQKLLSQVDVVINAGDPDREGQLLVDELLEESGYTGKTERIWITDVTKIKEFYKNRKDNSEYKKYTLSAQTRSRSDWLVGINFTRAFTIKFTALGGKGSLSVGRIITPTLNIVVEREKEIRNFKPKDYFELLVDFDDEGQIYKGKWVPTEDKTDFEGYVLEKNNIEKIIEKIKDKTGFIKEVQKRTNKVKPPMPFTLDTLQKFCSTKFKISAKQTLEIAQSLYEKHKLTTYPRTESAYLSMGQFQEAENIFKQVNRELPINLDNADFSKKHEVFNDSKLDAHHGIIPTGGGSISGLNEEEKKVYKAIVNRYLGCFYSDKVTETIKITTSVEDEIFNSTFSKIIKLGWTELEGVTLENEKDLPIVSKGDKSKPIEFNIQSKKTSPPTRFDEGSLIEAMKKVSKFVKNPEIKKKLKETSGLGTSATRADIVERLKKTGLISIGKGNKIFAEKKGEILIDLLPSKITDPGMSALWEDALSLIEKGKLTPDEFLEKQKAWVEQIVLRTLDNTDDVLVKPSEKLMDFAIKISEVLDISLPDSKDKISIGKFVNKHIEEFKLKNDKKPSEKQIQFAQRIANANDIELPKECFNSSKACSAFINENEIPPSEKQILLVEKISKEKDLELPKNYQKSAKVCSDFLDKAFKKNGKTKFKKRRRK